jgi:hypothetical protein
MQFILAYLGKGFDAGYTDTCTFVELREWYEMLIKAKKEEAKAMAPPNMLEQ